MTIEQVFKAICENPEDDELRLVYASQIEPSDPDHALFIRIQMESAERWRRKLDWDSEPQQRLIDRHGARWARNLLKFTAHSSLDNVDFYRGFPAMVRLQSAIFEEYADLLFRLAPIRHVDFVSPLDDDGDVLKDESGDLVAFPMARLMACSQLSRLDSIGFWLTKFRSGLDRPSDIVHIASSPHLTRCLALDFRFAGRIYTADYLALAEGELTGKMLSVEPIDAERTIHDIEIGKGEYKRTVFDEEWKAVERRLGYIPWLHPWHHKVNRYDARWQMEQGNAPKYPPGSPQQDEWYDRPTRWKGDPDFYY